VATDKSSASSADLAAGLVDEGQRLVHLELDLAKQELKELAIRNGVAIALFAVAGLLLTLGIFVGIPVLVVVWIPNHVLAAAIWIGAYVLVALILALVGRVMLKLAPPERTIASLKETKEWVVRQISSSAR
jgi:uncharacterized membrane protein YqjE